MSIFSKVGNKQFFLRNCTHILTRTQGKKFEDMFLVKIASKETSLSNAMDSRLNNNSSENAALNLISLGKTLWPGS